MKTPKRVLLPALVATALALSGTALADPDDHFIVRDSEQTREALAGAIREYVEADDDWIFLAEFGLA